MTYFLCQAKGEHGNAAPSPENREAVQAGRAPKGVLVVKKRKKVAQSCPTLCDPMDCSLPGSSMSGIFQASGKEPVCKSRRERHGSIPGSGRAPRGGCGSPLQSSCLENPMDTGAWGAAVHGVAKGRTLSQHTHTGRPGVVRLSSLACFSLLQSFKGWGC